MSHTQNTQAPRAVLLLSALAFCASAMASGPEPVEHAAPAAGQPAHWSYQGEGGPRHWGDLESANTRCSLGQQQSPVDINASKAMRRKHGLALQYGSLRVGLVNNGHTVQADPVAPADAPAITLDGKRYTLAQFHFHHPSEHTVGGKRFPMEMHLVHKDDEGHLAVLGVFIREGAANRLLADVFGQLPVAGGTAGAPIEVSLADMLPGKHDAWVYQGSLTTPPCSEGVEWVVLKQPISLSRAQIAAFTKLFPDNHRPVQNFKNRQLD